MSVYVEPALYGLNKAERRSLASRVQRAFYPIRQPERGECACQPMDVPLVEILGVAPFGYGIWL